MDKKSGKSSKNWLLDLQNVDLPNVPSNELQKFGFDRFMEVGKGQFIFEAYEDEKDKNILIGVDM